MAASSLPSGVSEHTLPSGVSEHTYKMALGLGEKLMNAGSEFIQMGKTLACAEATLNQEQPVLPEGFAKSLEKQAWAIDAFVLLHNTIKEGLASESLQGIEPLVREILETQRKIYADQLRSMSTWAVNIYQNAALRQEAAAEALVPALAQKVVQYLQSRRGQSLLEARQLEEAISEKKRSASALNMIVAKLQNREITPSESQESERMQRLLLFINPSDPISVALNWLEAAAAERKTADDLKEVFEQPIEKINAAIDHLHAQLGSSRVNFWVWKLAPEPKVGKNFGLVHRYDDLSRLRDALRNSAKEAVEKILQAHGADQDAIFACLFEQIGRPEVESPQQWMRENACYYLEKVPAAITQALQLKNRQIIVMPPHPHSASSSSFQPQTPVQTADATTRVLQTLEDLAERKGILSAEMKEQLNKVIADIDRRAQKSIVNKYVYEFSTDPKKGGSNWGLHHRFDDAAVLHWAIQKALSTLSK